MNGSRFVKVGCDRVYLRDESLEGNRYVRKSRTSSVLFLSFFLSRVRIRVKKKKKKKGRSRFERFSLRVMRLFFRCVRITILRHGNKVCCCSFVLRLIKPACVRSKGGRRGRSSSFEEKEGTAIPSRARSMMAIKLKRDLGRSCRRLISNATIGRFITYK